MKKVNNNLPKLFKIACANAGISRPKFAKMHGVTHQAIYNVLNGRGTSKRLEKAIDQFIADEFAKLKIQYKKAA